MARILTISSQVIRGHVGNSIAGYALARLGHEVWQLPTIILSNHPGHLHSASLLVDPGQAGDMLDALAANGWLQEVDAVISGYLPSPEHVALVGDLIQGLRSKREIIYLCDPILGDDPKGLYIDQAAADAIQQHLIPVADVATPNWFELKWMMSNASQKEPDLDSLLMSLGPNQVLVTSMPAAAGTMIANALFVRGAEKHHNKFWTIEVPRLAHVPHGSGDLLAALYLGHVMNAKLPTDAFAASVAGVEATILDSTSSDELRLINSQHAWLVPRPIVPKEIFARRRS